MSKASDRAAVVNTICMVAKQVKNTLISNSYLYIFEERAIEVVYRAKDFMHLTGVETSMRSEDFFRNAVSGKLKPNQIWFSERHAYDTCKKKMSQLHKLPNIVDSELLMLEDVTTEHIVFSFGLTDLTFTVGLSGDYDRSTGKRLGDYYVARSFRVEDSFKRSKDGTPVNFILQKRNDEKLYHIVKYADEKKQLQNIPNNIKIKIEPRLFSSQQI